MKYALVFPALALASCIAPAQMYPGEPRGAEQVARVEGRVQSLVYDLTIGLVIAIFVHPLTDEVELDVLRILRVDGAEANNSRVEILPGPTELEVYGVHYGELDSPTSDVVQHGARLEFDAKAGGSYRIRAIESEHAMPWAFEILDESSGESLANSLPTYDEIRIPELDLDDQSNGWALSLWRTFFEGTELVYLPDGETFLRSKEWLRIQRQPLSDPDMTVEQLGLAADQPLPGPYKIVSDLRQHGDHWVRPWHVDRPWIAWMLEDRWGVSVGTIIEGEEYVWSYTAVGKLDSELQREWVEYLSQVVIRALRQEIPADTAKDRANGDRTIPRAWSEAAVRSEPPTRPSRAA
ncbi:MAG: hypothetical protein AAGG01_04400 [Planctomycetota bacterium]